MIAYFDRFCIEMTLEQALSASHQGRCDEDVQELVKQKHIQRQLSKIGADPIRNELREYGAWDEDQLNDDEVNKARIVWLAAGNIVDDSNSRRK